LLRDNPQAPTEMRPPAFITPGAPDGFILPPVPTPERRLPAPAAGGELLRDLLLRGNTVIGREELLDVAKPWLNHPVNAADLEALRIEITRHYVQRGYINSGAVIGDDGWRDGVLTLDIVEGKVSAVRYAGLDGLDEHYLNARLFPEPDRPLNMNELRERYQLLLDDPLIKRMNARLVPDAAPGSAILDITVERDTPWYANFRFNNYRPASIGETAFTVDAGLRNLTGQGDLLRLSAQPVENFGGLARTGIGWSMPLGHAGTQLSLQYDEGLSSVVEEPLKAIDVRSRLTSREIGISQNLFENLRRRIAIGLGYTHRNNHTSIAGEPFPFIAGEPADGIETRALRFWQEYTQRSEADVLALRSTFVRAKNNLQPLPAGANATVGDREYPFWLGQAQYARRVSDDGAQLIVRGTVQHSTARMLSLDGLSIGGAGSVRGFRENQLVRDRGYILNLELDLPVHKSAATEAALNMAPFIDYGRGRNRDAESQSIGSAGVALRWRWGQVAAELAWARRIHASAGYQRAGSTLQDHGVHFQIGYAFGR
jgi:hemolysin activation/secretion protein